MGVAGDELAIPVSYQKENKHMNTIISKRTNNIEIAEYRIDTVAHQQIPVRSVTILGGAGILDPKTLVTPEGVATEISDEALEWLERQPKFQRGVKAGIFRVIRGSRARDVDADEIASSGLMEDNDKIPGRPLTVDQLKKEGAVVNSDGSIDVTKGGKDAPSTISLNLDNARRGKKDFATGKSEKTGRKRK